MFQANIKLESGIFYNNIGKYFDVVNEDGDSVNDEIKRAFFNDVLKESDTFIVILHTEEPNNSDINKIMDRCKRFITSTPTTTKTLIHTKQYGRKSKSDIIISLNLREYKLFKNLLLFLSSEIDLELITYTTLKSKEELKTEE